METYEKGSTAQFDFEHELDAAPTFTARQADVIVASFTAASSGNGMWYALFAPETEGAFVGEWRGVQTIASSAYAIVSRFPIYVTRTRA